MSKFVEQRLQEAVYLKRGKNLFNKNNASYIDGIGIGADGNMFSRTDQRLYIVEITQNTEDITISWTKTNSGSRKYALTNEIPNMNSTLPNYVTTASTTGKLITTMQNNNYKYLVLALTASDNLDDLQIEYGSNATSYEDYVEKRLLDVRGEEIVNLDEMKNTQKINVSDYISIKSEFTVHELYGYKSGNVVYILYNIAGTISQGETVIGSVTNKVKMPSFGASRIINNGARLPATTIAMPGRRI